LAPWTSPGVTLRYTVTPPEDSGSMPAYFADSFVRAPYGWSPIADTAMPSQGSIVLQSGMLPGSDFAECEDAFIINHNQEGNTGGCLWLEEGDWDGGVGDRKKILIRFDLPAELTAFLPQRAELRLFNFDERKQGARNAHTLYVARILKSWGEGSGDHRNGILAEPGEVNFLSSRHEMQTWELPGAMGRTDVADPESSATVGADWPEWVSFDVTDSVRYFLEHPDENFGWKISQDAGVGIADDATSYVLGAYRFKSSESVEAHLRPMLILHSVSSDE
jgi:hypothetical protein